MTIPAPREPAEQGAAPQARVVRIVKDTEPVAPASIRAVTRPRPGTGYARHRFLVGGTVAILSDVDLPELEYFRVPTLGQDVDIEIRKGPRRPSVSPVAHPDHRVHGAGGVPLRGALRGTRRELLPRHG